MPGEQTAMPEEYTFSLRRRAVVIPLLVLVAGTAVALGAATYWGPFRDTGCGPVVRWGLFLLWCFVGVPLASSACAAQPQTIRLGSGGVEVTWRDRSETWPWESWAGRPRRGAAVTFARDGHRFAPDLALLSRPERQVFRRMVVRQVEGKLGAVEAERLAVGEPVRPSDATGWGSVALSVVFWAYLLWRLGPAVEAELQASSRADPQSAAAMLASRVVLVAFVAVVIAASIYSDLRRWREIRFQADGLHERWPLGSQVWAYGDITEVRYGISAAGSAYLSVRASKKQLRFRDDRPGFWGVVTLLRDHAPQAWQTEET